jgi:hypothetical protein
MTEVKKGKYAMSVKSNSARDFADTISSLVKQYVNLKIYMFVTPTDTIKFDPITFEPSNKHYESYGAVLTYK